MGEKLKEFKKHQIVHIPAIADDDEKKYLETSENDMDGSLPLGLTGKAVCMQVFIIN